MKMLYMETLFIPTESDFKKWVKEAVAECLEGADLNGHSENKDEPLLNRKEIAKLLRVSLVTLTDWMKRGLPSHRLRGRVYFMRSEVMDYIKQNQIRQFKFSSRYIETE